MIYSLPVYGWHYGYGTTAKKLLGYASYDYASKESYVQMEELDGYPYYYTASPRQRIMVHKILHRAQCAIRRIATQEERSKYEFRYIYDTRDDEFAPIACVAMDTETGWHGLSVVSNEPESKTVVKRKFVKSIDEQTGEEKRFNVSIIKTINALDSFRYDIAKQRAIENIGNLRIPQRHLKEYDVTLKQIVHNIINDWELA